MFDAKQPIFGHAHVTSAVLRGVESVWVDVEACVYTGVPSFTITGVEASAETAEVVRCAILSAGYVFPRGMVVVRVEPACISKWAPSLELAIAAAVLMASEQVPKSEGSLFVGGLQLCGMLSGGTRGMIAHAVAAREMGCTLVCGTDVGLTPEVFSDTDVRCIKSLANLRDDTPFDPFLVQPNFASDMDDGVADDGCDDVFAAALREGKSILLMGDPDAAHQHISRIRGLVSPLNPEERLECSAIASAAGEGSLLREVAAGLRPIRCPHHSVSLPGLLGGGRPVYPGEVSLAHNGVLVLEDLHLFSPNVLMSLSQAVDTGEVGISRPEGLVTMPGRFQLVATCKPCPCGNYGQSGRCTCSAWVVSNYQARMREALGRPFDMVLAC